MASHALSPIAISPSTSYSPSVGAPSLPLPWGLSSNSFVIGQRLSIRPSNFRILPLKRQNSVATVLLSLPTAKTDRALDGNNPKWSSRSIRSFSLSKLEARKLKYPQTGTESLLMGILVEGTSIAAKFLRANGITLFKVREETVNLLGKSDMYFFSPESPPLTEPAQRALDWAVDEKLKSGEAGEITVTRILLGIWSDQDSAGHRIMATLGFDDDKAKELAKSIDKDFVASYN